MTISEIHALRAERDEIVNLLADIECARSLLDMSELNEMTGGATRSLTAFGFAHQTLGSSMRHRADHGLIDRPQAARSAALPLNKKHRRKNT
jgi:hypothetical protein